MPTTATDFGMFAPCFYFPVCGGLVAPGQTVCDTCCNDFGEYLATTTTARTTEPVEDPVPPPRTTHERRERQESGELPRFNQLCWLCENRRACHNIGGRWECSTCQTVAAT